MSIQKFVEGIDALMGGLIVLPTDALDLVLLDLTATATACKPVTGVSNANPAVYTCTAHGYANGDLVVVGGVLGNLSANQTGRVAAQATNTFELDRLDGGGRIAGSGAYVSGGYALNLSLASVNADLTSCLKSAAALASITYNNKVLDAADPAAFTALNGPFGGWLIRKNSGGRFLLFNDGRTVVTVAADAASSATTIWVEPLEGPLPTGTVLAFSNGVVATMSAPAVAGARSLSVAALSGAIAAGHQAEGAMTDCGFPVTFGAGNGKITIAFDNGANKIAAFG